MTKIAGSTALITGGGSGIGRLLAVGMGRLGGRIVIWDIDPDGLERTTREVKEATGRDAHGYVVDVSDREQVYDAAERVATEVGEIDILVNNAGIVSGRAFLDNPDENVERTFAVNTLALFWMTKAFLPAMIERGEGHLVTTISMSAIVTPPRLADYGASKAAAKSLHESVRRELRELAPDVKTTAVFPYYVNTGMFDVKETSIPALVPILEERTVARKIVDGILRDKARVVIPGHHLLTWALWTMPTHWFDAALERIGIADALHRLHDRTGPEDVAELEE